MLVEGAFKFLKQNIYILKVFSRSLELENLSLWTTFDCEKFTNTHIKKEMKSMDT